jgi:hypothetical protein
VSEVESVSNPPENFRPETTGALYTFGQVSTDPKVIATNLLLAIILLLTMFTSTQLFNDALDDHRKEVDSFLAGLMAPFRRAIGPLHQVWLGLVETEHILVRLASPIAVLVLIGLVYLLDEPGVGANEKTIVLLLSLLIGTAVITYVYEGGQVLFARHRLGINGSVRVFPFAVVMALATVAVSRLANLQPTVIYGFVAGATITAPIALQRRDVAHTLLFPALVLFGIAMGAWALLSPLRDVASNGDWWSFLPGEIAAMLFISGIEGLVFSMLPIRFTDGSKIMAWNKLAWVLAFGVPLFLFCWVILNPAAKSFDAMLTGRVLMVCSVVAAYAAIGVFTWSYFHFRHRPAGAEA